MNLFIKRIFVRKTNETKEIEGKNKNQRKNVENFRNYLKQKLTWNYVKQIMFE